MKLRGINARMIHPGKIQVGSMLKKADPGDRS
jgi:hypothetical protein